MVIYYNYKIVKQRYEPHNTRTLPLLTSQYNHQHSMNILTLISSTYTQEKKFLVHGTENIRHLDLDLHHLITSYILCEIAISRTSMTQITLDY